MRVYIPPSAFDPYDLAIIEQVYEDALAQINASDPLHDPEHEAEREAFLRRRVFALASRPLDYDSLLQKVLSGFEVWTVIPFQMAKKGRKNHPR
jgi:hypothetical protein